MTDNRYTLVSELLHTIPGSFFYSRRGLSMKQVCAHATDKGFTNIIVLNESRKTPCSLVMSHLPAGLLQRSMIRSLYACDACHRQGPRCFSSCQT